MAGEVGDGEHLVSQGWNQEQINLGEQARHLDRDFSAETVALHKVHSGEESRLAKCIWPGVRYLHFEFVKLAAEAQVFEGRSSFGEKDYV